MNPTLLQTAALAPETADVTAAAEPLRQRLRTAARYLALLADQVEAAGHADGRHAASEERDALERDLCTAPDEAPRDMAAELARLVEQAIGSLDGRSEEEQRARDWLGALQDASLPLLRHMALRPRTAGRYGGAATRGARFNVRL